MVEGLPAGRYSLLLTKRNQHWWSRFTFNGLLAEGKELLPPSEKPARRIEFTGRDGRRSTMTCKMLYLRQGRM